jgi:hypothetical protein
VPTVQAQFEPRKYMNLSEEQFDRVMHIIKQNNLPTENPTLRLDVKPMHLD